MANSAAIKRGIRVQGESVARPALTVLASSAIFFLISLDTLIVNVALPTIMVELGGDITTQQWIIDGYTLAFASLLLLMGNFCDRLGARRMFAVGTAAFGASSVFCMFATSAGMLVAGRALLGVSAAAVLPASMAVIREAYVDDDERARALGIWMSGGSVAAAAGPLLGGLLTPINWSLIFAVNVPVCVAALFLVRFIAPSPRRAVPVDLVGQVLATLGIVALVGSIIEGGARGYGDPLVLAMLVVGVLALTAFVRSQAQSSHPMMPLSLFGPRGMRIALFVGFAFILSWFGTVFLCSTYLQQGLGLSPFAAGLAFVPSSVASFVGNLASGKLTARFGARVAVVLGFSVEIVGIVGLAVLSPSLTMASAAALLAVVGLGGSATMPAISSVVLASAPAEQSGIASALFNTFRQVGASVGVAAFGAVVAISSSMSGALTVCFGVTAVLLAMALLGGMGLERK